MWLLLIAKSIAFVIWIIESAPYQREFVGHSSYPDHWMIFSITDGKIIE
jgi:hypothetical protein